MPGQCRTFHVLLKTSSKYKESTLQVWPNLFWIKLLECLFGSCSPPKSIANLVFGTQLRLGCAQTWDLVCYQSVKMDTPDHREHSSKFWLDKYSSF